MIFYAENTESVEGTPYAGHPVSYFYETYDYIPEELEDVMKSLKEDFKDVKMMDFSKME
jgi:hypothetical protein